MNFLMEWCNHLHHPLSQETSCTAFRILFYLHFLLSHPFNWSGSANCTSFNSLFSLLYWCHQKQRHRSLWSRRIRSSPFSLPWWARPLYRTGPKTWAISLSLSLSLLIPLLLLCFLLERFFGKRLFGSQEKHVQQFEICSFVLSLTESLQREKTDENFSFIKKKLFSPYLSLSFSLFLIVWSLDHDL